LLTVAAEKCDGSNENRTLKYVIVVVAARIEYCQEGGIVRAFGASLLVILALFPSIIFPQDNWAFLGEPDAREIGSGGGLLFSRIWIAVLVIAAIAFARSVGVVGVVYIVATVVAGLGTASALADAGQSGWIVIPGGVFAAWCASKITTLLLGPVPDEDKEGE
jgi:hypothetical protein